MWEPDKEQQVFLRDSDVNMKKYFLYLFLFFYLQLTAQQAPLDFAITFNDPVYDASNYTLQLNWANSSADIFVVERKYASEQGFYSQVGLNPFGNGFIDYQVYPGEVYEYRVRSLTNNQKQGYFTFAANKDTEPMKGYVLIVRGTSAQIPSIYFDMYLEDLEGDGYKPLVVDVIQGWSDQTVKNTIINYYYSYPRLQHVVLLGNVPIPLSGYIYPDGHADHEGAWPADTYYADINGYYTDSYLNYASGFRNNLPGDNRHDQSLIPDPDSSLELSVGRIDFHGETAYGLTEAQMYDYYYYKVHAFRDKLIQPRDMAIISDNFGYFAGEMFSVSGWRSFIPAVGLQNINTQMSPFSTQPGNDFKFMYACGGGTYTSMGGLGGIQNYLSNGSFVVFNMLFGSYFGDYAVNGGLLKAPLASAGYGLTSCWSGRPLLYMHQMASGLTIGECMKQSQNNSGNTYLANYGARFIHTALLGDPSLCMNVLEPVHNLQVQTLNETLLHWSPPLEQIQGYVVYRKEPGTPHFYDVAQVPASDTSFIDPAIAAPGTKYMVRAFTWHQGRGGSYKLYSNGEIATVDSSFFLTHTSEKIKQINMQVFPNPASSCIHVDVPGIPAEPGTFLSICNMMGKEMYRAPFIPMAKIEIPSMASGLYMISIHYPEGKLEKSKLTIIK